MDNDNTMARREALIAWADAHLIEAKRLRRKRLLGASAHLANVYELAGVCLTLLADHAPPVDQSFLLALLRVLSGHLEPKGTSR